MRHGVVVCILMMPTTRDGADGAVILLTVLSIAHSLSAGSDGN